MVTSKIETIKTQVRNLKYPESMRKVCGEIKGNGFFPGARGLHSEVKDITGIKYLVLGQDQDKESGFERSKNIGNEEYTATWRNMLDPFKDSGISMEDCFFTNVLMGVRKNAKSNAGRSPGFDHPEFVKQCLEILKLTIEKQEPKGIICLGMWPAKFLGLLSNQLAMKMFAQDTYLQIDQRDAAVNFDVVFEIDSGFKTHVVLLTHPSYRKLNASKRNYGQKKKDADPEINMLMELHKRVTEEVK